MREVNAEAGQLLNTNDITTVVCDLDISDNGIKSGEYRVGQVRRNSTMIVMQMDDERRNVAVRTKRAGQLLQRGLPLDHCVRLVLEVADCKAFGVLDVHSWNAKVSPAKVWKLAAEMGLGGPSAAIGHDLCNGVFRYTVSEVIQQKIACRSVHVEAVRDIFAVEGK